MLDLLCAGSKSTADAARVDNNLRILAVSAVKEVGEIDPAQPLSDTFPRESPTQASNR